ncbi:MAG: cupredoxin domain-containing protein [Thermoleophilaceae bacterium]
MSTTTHAPNHTLPELEDELHELEESNDVLEQRAGNLEMKSGLVVLFTFFALALAIAALVVALVNAGSEKTVVTRTVAAAAPAAPAAAKTPARAPSANGKVAVTLGEMFVRPGATSVKSGKVTFNVHNSGKLVHEMIVARTPIAVAGSRASEKTSVGEVSELRPGTSGHVKLNLKPGSYVLFCNVPGHYAAGQHVAFTVTKS